MHVKERKKMRRKIKIELNSMFSPWKVIGKENYKENDRKGK